jgi:phosphate transport system permease protein
MSSALPAAVAKGPDLSKARIRKRYAAEARFKFYGLAAISVAILFLAILLVSIVSKGYTAFVTTTIALDVTLDSSVIYPDGTKNVEALSQADYRALVRSSIRTLFPEGTARSEERGIFGVFSEGAQYDVMKLVMNNPSLVGTTQRVWVKAAPDIDMLRKGFLQASDDGGARITVAQENFLKKLDADGKVRTVFNTTFFTAADSREAEQAGILGALVGTFMTLAVCLILVLPIGIAAAVYLEEFAPKNRWTDIIEVNINNLAAVPSIVFGLLGVAVLLQWFGMPRSAPVAGGVVLALLVLPTIIIAGRSALKAVPPSIREAALGVGASRLQTIGHHVLPLAMPGILTGTIIGMAHALGESAPLLMIGMVAFVVDVPTSFTQASTVLPVQIFLWADAPERAFVERTSAAIIVLLVFLILMNLVAILLRKRFERRW